MNETTVVLTDEQCERLAEEERRRGLPAAELIRRALDAYLGIANGASEPAATRHDSSEDQETPSASSRLWFVGLGNSGRSDFAANIEEFLAEEWTRDIIEDSFGGTRSSDITERANDANDPGNDERPRSPR